MASTSRRGTRRSRLGWRPLRPGWLRTGRLSGCWRDKGAVRRAGLGKSVTGQMEPAKDDLTQGDRGQRVQRASRCRSGMVVPGSARGSSRAAGRSDRRNADLVDDVRRVVRRAGHGVTRVLTVARFALVVMVLVPLSARPRLERAPAGLGVDPNGGAGVDRCGCLLRVAEPRARLNHRWDGGAAAGRAAGNHGRPRGRHAAGAADSGDSGGPGAGDGRGRAGGLHGRAGRLWRRPGRRRGCRVRGAHVSAAFGQLSTPGRGLTRGAHRIRHG